MHVLGDIGSSYNVSVLPKEPLVVTPFASPAFNVADAEEKKKKKKKKKRIRQYLITSVRNTLTYQQQDGKESANVNSNITDLEIDFQEARKIRIRGGE